MVATRRNRLIEFRRARTLTQAEMADQLAISVPQMSRLETGKRDPRAPLLKQFASTYNLDLPAVWSLFFE